ncbi:GDSL esterase/lipase [Quillaja saponaria]|uniref:GDSL esterase/lipase n=1 Tax=Quillaja saponaria TaxID=32244 RepID=A0AAD7M4F0_QUISA|nr:GDSL esterase/lipase [Quillaja saponaria]
MACENLVFWVAIVLLGLVHNQSFVVGEPQVPCLFIFGDSLSDSGNNNNLLTSAKANYQPYGIDFPNGPTGRFTNGRTGVDIIAELLGFNNFIPPFATVAGPDILKGVNYASGGSGIRDETGQHLGAHISFDLQLINHKIVISGIANAKRLRKSYIAQEQLNKCLYYVGIGSNDYINNYFLPEFYPTSRLFNPQQYAVVLIEQYNLQLRVLYQLGARKFALVGLGLIGCTPNALFSHKINGTSCVQEMNTAVVIFNDKLISLIDRLNQELSDAKFIYVNTTGLLSGNPASAGFKVFSVGCCPVGKNGQCNPSQAPCQNRNEYLFWDSFHPTEAVNQITAARSYKASSPFDTYPMDISHLVQQ